MAKIIEMKDRHKAFSMAKQTERLALTQRLFDDNSWLISRIEHLEDALKFYANKENYRHEVIHNKADIEPIMKDGGRRAKDVLTEG